MAKIAFIVPCYNSEEFLSPCLESLTCQTLKDVEFIFVDDGSTDKTREVLENFLRIDARAKLVIQTNSGLAAARLAGLRSATTDLVAFLDSDDFLDITVAQEATGIFENNSSVDAVLYNFTYLKNGAKSPFNYSMVFPVSGIDVLRYTIPSWRISTMGVYRRHHALKAYASLPFSAINSDEIATRLIFESCHNVARMESQYFYVQRSGSISKKPSIKYLSRLMSAAWLREYAICKLANHVPRKDADNLYINELCEIMLKFRSYHKTMGQETRQEWRRGIAEHRRYVLRNCRDMISTNPLAFIFDAKLIKKTMFICFWPVLDI